MATETNGPVIIGVTWMLFVLCSAFLAVRIYAKISRRQGLWWDDHILIFSWAMLAIESILTQTGYERGFGRHVYDMEPENISRVALYTSIAASISCFASTGSKISFGVTLLRLTHGWWRRFVWFSVISLFLVMLPSAIFTWVQCSPSEKAWNSAIPGTCWDPSITVNYGIFNAAYCTVIDFALALIPWKLISGLQMKTREKIGVSIAMSMGILSGVCAIVKGVYIVQLRQQDFFYNGKDVTIWTATETAVAIIGASIPVLRVLFKEKMSTRGYNKESERYGMPLSTVGGTKRTIGGARMDGGGDLKSSSHGWSTSIVAKGDNDSDRSILGDDNVPTNTGIMQTNEYVIDFHQANQHPSGPRSPV
ncbi:hypothetical protein JX265_010538 [Neoarthrinium moseri]|uniref:Rhodopsin domain-containing protein n=1 Tax=Neoarthrinium moseri TaxID=1658444 RepID=A0A9Q0ALG0_9PEZI|nr:uncharacterized protein JN550_012380 [Neoarthrinium moseri]KAI1846160.1 hypothetical protein JX266_007685 [Neoarthrinium moseri]KAI1858818.1 hypothetical protein JN550_012380 [Neoarthrinium moseri]KAI1859061.1 hypothetical protein JX265_010538 [Neoarthrinium moseri]